MSSPIVDHLRTVQARLQSLYDLEPAPDVAEFVRFEEGVERETVLVHQADSSVDIAVLFRPTTGPLEHLSDTHMELIEGVSHFVFLAERARTELPTTLLELELQAEVDKFALIALDTSLSAPRRREMHNWLYERAEFIHPEDTEQGRRYRLANRLAARLMAALMTSAGPQQTWAVLKRFYRSGQTEKIRMARAA